MPQVSKYTNNQGTRRLGSLFLENLASAGPEAAVYTLKDYNYDYKGKHYPSLYLLYMACSDPTEYNFANTHLCDWTHWEMLTAAEWFQVYVTRWRRELELKLRADALARLLLESKQEGREGHSASRYLLDRSWDKSPSKTTKGRPSKQDIKKAAHEIATEAESIQTHFERLISPKITGLTS